MQSAVGMGGENCRVVCGSYIGTGTYGAANPVSIECGFCPLLVVVKESTAYQYWMLRGYNKFSGANSRENVVSWGDTGVSWYYPKEDQYFPPAGNQLNSRGTTYYYLVLGYSN